MQAHSSNSQKISASGALCLSALINDSISVERTDIPSTIVLPPDVFIHTRYIQRNIMRTQSFL